MTVLQKRAIFLLFAVTCIAVVSLYFAKSDKSDATISEGDPEKNTTDTPVAFEQAPSVILTFNLESNDGLQNTETITEISSGALSGNNICRFSDKTEYGVTILRNMGEFQSVLPLSSLNFSFHARTEKPAGEILVVCSFENKDGQSVYWQSFGVTEVTTDWKEYKFTFDISQVTYQADYHLKVYIWNKSLSEFDTDEYKLEVE